MNLWKLVKAYVALGFLIGVAFFALPFMGLSVLPASLVAAIPGVGAALLTATALGAPLAFALFAFAFVMTAHWIDEGAAELGFKTGLGKHTEQVRRWGK